MDVQRRYPFHAILRAKLPQNITGRGWILEPWWEVRDPRSISLVARGEQLRGRFDVGFAEGDNGDGHRLTSGLARTPPMRIRSAQRAMKPPRNPR
jgi:hypothetical protein